MITLLLADLFTAVGAVLVILSAIGIIAEARGL